MTSRRKRDPRLRRLVAALAVVAGGVSGCQAGTPPDPQYSFGGTPVFSGPWAEEYRLAWARVDNSLAREFLFDEEITADEMLRLDEAFVACMYDAGAEVASVTSKGGWGFGLYGTDTDTRRAALEPAMLGCEVATGWREVSPLYQQSRSNPDHLDWRSMMAECLVQVGVRAAGYSPDDFAHEYSSSSNFSNGDYESLDWLAFSACESDPRAQLSVFEVEARCFVRLGLRDTSYTGADFERQFFAGELSEVYLGGDAFYEDARCYLDPFYAR